MSLELPTTITGTTTAYTGYGRELGYPTANIENDTELADGVYFGFADLADFVHHPAMIFIGVPTTVGDTSRRVEAHLLDISDQDYYGLPLHLEIQQFYRANQTFPSVAELQEHMSEDEHAARQWFIDQA